MRRGEGWREGERREIRGERWRKGERRERRGQGGRGEVRNGEKLVLLTGGAPCLECVNELHDECLQSFLWVHLQQVNSSVLRLLTTTHFSTENTVPTVASCLAV